jgi:hypothetical protein
MIEGWPEKIFAAQQSPSYAFRGKMLVEFVMVTSTTMWGANDHLPTANRALFSIASRYMKLALDPTTCRQLN